MARKEEKLRPYRVDYFDIIEMKGDKALIQSVIIRAVTAKDAEDVVLYGGQNHTGAPIASVLANGRILIRAYRFYKKLTRRKNVYKPVEDLFSANKAIDVMETVEKWRKLSHTEYHVTEVPATLPPNSGDTLKVVPKFDRSSSIFPWEGITNSTLPEEEKKRMLGDAYVPPTSGPASPATQAVVADLQGMTDHDAHEQTIDTFVPKANQPTEQVSKVITLDEAPAHFDLDAAAPIIHPAPTAVEESVYRACFPNQPVVPTQDAKFDDSEMVITSTGSVNARWVEPPSETPLWAKVLLFGGTAILAVILILAILHCPGK